MSEAPFVPEPAELVDDSTPEAPPWRLLSSRPFLRLWGAQVTSSLGDWIGILAILALAADLSNSVAAVSLVMAARMVPGFFLAPVGGVLVDRLDRRQVMVVTDLGRVAIFVALPFLDSLWLLVAASFVIEIFTLLWGTAKDASVPNIVERDQLATANTLGMVAAYGTFPVGGLIFASLAGIAAALVNVGALSWIPFSQVALALWFDALTFLVSALLILGLPLGRAAGVEKSSRRIDLTETFRDIWEGLCFLTSHRLVRGVIVGLGIGIIGGGAMVPLGPVFARQVLNGGPAIFSLLMVALGTGAAVGVIGLLWAQRWVSRSAVFPWAVVTSGLAIVLAATFSGPAAAALCVGVVGAAAGVAYICGFTVLQEEVADELRGRTFAALYTVVRACMLFSLTIAPLFADLYGWIVDTMVDNGEVSIGGADYALPGVRIALWAGGVLTVLAGVYAGYEIRTARLSMSDA